MVSQLERERQYEDDVSAVCADRHRKLQLARSQESDANRLAKSIGLRVERGCCNGDPAARSLVYSIARGPWSFAKYCPTTHKLTIANGLKVVDAATLIKAVELAQKYEGVAPKSGPNSQPPLARPPRKRGKKPKTTHKPKKAGHMAKGAKLERGTILPGMFLTNDDLRRIIQWGEFHAQADEATGIDDISLNRELVERVKEAQEEGARIIYDPRRRDEGAFDGEAELVHWELN